MIESYKQIDGPIDVNKITWLANFGVINLIRDRHGMVVVHGPSRIGKSAYVSLSSAECIEVLRIIEERALPLVSDDLGKLRIRSIKLKIFREMKAEKYEIVPDWRSVQKYFVFKPRDLIHVSRTTRGKQAMIIQDDSGKWLNAKEHATKFVKAVTSNFEVIGSKWGTVVFTCKNLRQLVSLARDDPDVYTIRIMDDAQEDGGGLLPQRRIAKVHAGWESEDTKKSGKKWIDQNIFYAWMNENFYAWYNPIRDKLCTDGWITMERELDALIANGESQYS